MSDHDFPNESNLYSKTTFILLSQKINSKIKKKNHEMKNYIPMVVFLTKVQSHQKEAEEKKC